MPKTNGYFKEWTIALRTDDATYIDHRPINPTTGLRPNTVDGRQWEWKLNWLDAIPPDCPAGSSFRVTHKFIPANASVMFGPQNANAGNILYNMSPARTRSIMFLSTLANRSNVSNNIESTSANGNQVHGDMTNDRDPRTRFRPGYINSLLCTSSGTGPYTMNYTPQAPALTYSGTSVALTYSTEPFTFISYSPENMSKITIETSELNSDIADLVYEYPTVDWNEIPVDGLHIFTFKLIE